MAGTITTMPLGASDHNVRPATGTASAADHGADTRPHPLGQFAAAALAMLCDTVQSMSATQKIVFCLVVGFVLFALIKLARTSPASQKQRISR